MRWGDAKLSKLEREVDKLAGERSVTVEWPLSEKTLREYTWRLLKQEVDEHQFRVPLDLRKVQGVPVGFVELLQDLQEYAESAGKHVIIAHALPEMRLAISPASQPAGKRNAAAEETAGDAAWESLRENLSRDLAATRASASEPQRHSAARTSRSGNADSPKQTRTSLPRARWVQLAMAILAGTLLAGALEWAVLVYFQESHTEPLIVHERDFESP